MRPCTFGNQIKVEAVRVPGRREPLGKRAFDVAVGLVALVLLAPLFLAVVVGIVLTMGRPVFFRQSRGGLHDTTFDIIKFRTMTNATDAHGELLPDHERRHWFGDLLRSTSIDELPGLLNVVRGDMSLVGPRPLLTRYISRYDDRQRHRHDVRPGLTGLVQVSGRNALSWEERFELDLEYVRNRSLRLDAKILWATVRAVVGRTGADGIDHTDEFFGTRPTADQPASAANPLTPPRRSAPATHRT